MNDTGFLIFVKHPETGKVKTRLANDIGDDHAVSWYQQFVIACLDNYSKAKGVDCYIFFDPSEKELEIKEWLGREYSYIAQPQGDLGERLKYGMGLLLQTYSSVIALGTDTPDLPAEYLKQAVHQSKVHDLTLGPTEDGGYYLIGLNHLVPQLFENIPWSTESVISTTMQRAETHNLKVHLLPKWYDIDTVEDLQRFQRTTQSNP